MRVDMPRVNEDHLATLGRQILSGAFAAVRLPNDVRSNCGILRARAASLETAGTGLKGMADRATATVNRPPRFPLPAMPSPSSA
jgi:hypothetical protein